LYEASFQTPANIAVPDYGPDSLVIFVRGVLADTSGSVTVNAFNITAQEWQSSAFGTGILGAIIIGAVSAANVDNDVDDFGYPPIAVQLR